MKARRKILIILLVFAGGAIGISLLTMRVGPESRLDAYKDSLRAQGEKLEVADMTPPPVPPEQNGREAVETAFTSLGSGIINPPHTMWTIAPGKAIVGWAQPMAYGDDFTNSWDDYAALAAVNASAIESLRRAAERPKLDFGLDYRLYPALLLPHLAPFKRSAQALLAASTLDLHEGDPASAATNLCVLLHLIQANEDEGILISLLVRNAMAAIAVNGTWDFLQATNANDAQLAALQKAWADLQFIQPTEKALRTERAITLMVIQKSRDSGAYLDTIYSVGGGSPTSVGGWVAEMKWGVGKTLWRTSWSYSEEFNFLRGDQIVLQTLRTTQTNQCWKTNYDGMRAQLSKIPLSYPGQSLIKKLDIPDFDELFNNEVGVTVTRKTMAMEVARRVVITAIALKRFQLKYGNLPDGLAELIPDFLPALPLDPIDGNPLRYRKNDDGTYLLYSIGEDGVDNGGDAGITGSGKTANYYWQNSHSRDWVWPQPATRAEIKLYWDEPTAAAK